MHELTESVSLRWRGTYQLCYCVLNRDLADGKFSTLDINMFLSIAHI